MYALAFIVLMSGVMAMLSIAEDPFGRTHNEARNRVLAGNYVVYRNAVQAYLENHPGFAGMVADPSLPLPPGYARIGPWTNTLGAGQAIVSGRLPPGAAREAFVMLGRTTNFGVTDAAGQWRSPAYGVIGATPPGVPVGAAISVIDVN